MRKLTEDERGGGAGIIGAITPRKTSSKIGIVVVVILLVVAYRYLV